MTLLIPPNFALASFNFRYVEGSEVAITTLGMDLTGDTGTGSGRADAIAGAWQTHILPVQSNALTFVGVTLRVGTAGEPVVYEAPRSIGGSNVEAMVPRNTALLVKKITARGGRRGRGRMFVPGITPEAQIDQAGNLSALFRDNLQTNQFNALFNELNLMSGGPVLLHDDQVVTSYNSITGKPVYGTIDPGPPDQITQLVVDPKAATQRRRMR
jgi:hypothetical protein